MTKKLFNKKRSLREQARIARRLATLLGAGIPLLEAFTFIAKSASKKKSLAAAYRTIIQAIAVGQTCSHALAATGMFNQSLVQMVRIGERSGSLEEALVQAALQLERRDGLTTKIIGIMIYPALIGAATLGIALFLILYIFPKILPLVTSMNIRLPFLTRALMLVHSVMTQHWLSIALVIVVIASMALSLWRYSQIFREIVRRIVFCVPLAGPIIKGQILIEIFKSLGLLLEQGETLPQALASIRDGISYSEFRKILERSLTLINRGERLSAAFSSQHGNIFPSFVIDLIETGERTGGIGGACGTIARIYESEVDETIQRVSRVIEPVLMICMGGVVGSIALSIVMPIYEITSHLSH